MTPVAQKPKSSVAVMAPFTKKPIPHASLLAHTPATLSWASGLTAHSTCDPRRTPTLPTPAPQPCLSCARPTARSTLHHISAASLDIPPPSANQSSGLRSHQGLCCHCGPLCPHV